MGGLEPLLYRALHTGDWCSPLMLAIQTKSEGFLRNTCSGVVNLYVKGQSPPESLPVCANTRLQRLGLVISPADSELPRPTFELRVFLSITHLDLILEDAPKTRRSGWQDWSALVALPALTHLCLSYFPRAVLLRVAGECSSLSVLVATFWGSAIRRSAIALTQALVTSDLRIVKMMVPNPRVDWATGARGGDDFWLRAEAFIAKKRRGEIDESCYLLDNPGCFLHRRIQRIPANNTSYASIPGHEYWCIGCNHGHRTDNRGGVEVIVSLHSFHRSVSVFRGHLG
ncbi:hypothetical protein C8R47DRAFT_1171068 [Mycena vitilis]|nr:hypothetical protein C8R47DRAFT_1171068 [Mycena vitilis]